MVINQTE